MLCAALIQELLRLEQERVTQQKVFALVITENGNGENIDLELESLKKGLLLDLHADVEVR